MTGLAVVSVLVRKEVGCLVGTAVRRTVARRLRTALRGLARGRSSASLLLTDDNEIRRLNRAFRKLDRATDVLSFHMQELSGVADPAGDGVFLGDIVISVETACRRAGRTRLSEELERLAVHGLCHLFGHDHHRPGPARRMRELERQLLRCGDCEARRDLDLHCLVPFAPARARHVPGRCRPTWRRRFL